MDFDRLKKDLKGFLKPDTNKTVFLFKEGDLVCNKLTRQIFILEKNLVPNFLENRKRVLLKNKEGKKIVLFEHEITKAEEKKQDETRKKFRKL